jgi:DNA modification methylase
MDILDERLYHIHHGDCIPHLHELPERWADAAIFSPPFPSVFSYTSLPEDLGNSEDLKGEMKIHFGYFYRAMLRVLKPGRVMIVHVTQIHKRKRDGEAGVFDFRGFNIRLAQRAGFVFDYDWCIRRNPQAQAIRTRKWELKFQGLETDRAISRGAMPDYLLKFRAPGDNAVPIASRGEVSRNDWIEWAECTWTNIRETDTLNVARGRGEQDTRHICALQLELIRRLVKLYTNPGEIVLSPFAGIGSEIYSALLLSRRGYGIEIKDEYYRAALENCEKAIALRQEEQKTLFDQVGAV